MIGREKTDMKEDRKILLVEDNPDDEALTLRALKKHNIANQVVVVRNTRVPLCSTMS